jgi:glycosyltransferase involved in cell wall biosynthesis
MRILQVSNFYPPYWVGGYEQIAEWVGSGLREAGHEVEVLTGSGSSFQGRPAIHPDLDLDLARLWDGYFGSGIVAREGLAEGLRRHVFSGRNFAACRRVLARFRPDLVSFWNPAFITFSPLWAARLAGVPAVVHLSDTAVNPFRNPHPPRFPASLVTAGRAAFDLVLRAARPRRFVVPSAFLRDKFAAHERLPCVPVEVLHWPVEPTISRRAPPSVARTAWERLLFVGTLIPEKGPHVLLTAFREALRARPQLTLTLVGGGPKAYVDELRAVASDLPVRFSGRLDRGDVIAAYEAHDVLVFPSTWDEPFAVVPPEAMAMGLPVIASRAGGTSEAVVHEQTGLLVAPGDVSGLAAAILRLARDPVLATRLASAGQAWARGEHSFPAFLARIEGLYLDVAGRAS